MDEFEIIERAIGPAIEIEESVPVWRMPSAFSRDYRRIAEYIRSQDAEIAGMPYARYVDMDWQALLNRGPVASLVSMLFGKWHFFAGMPTSKTLPGQDNLKSVMIENRRYARAVHRGAYRESGKTYKALSAWVSAQGLSVQNEAFELYLNDPREVGEAQAETEILLPLQKS